MRISAAVALQIGQRPSASTFHPVHFALVIQPFSAVKCEALTERRQINLDCTEQQGIW